MQSRQRQSELGWRQVNVSEGSTAFGQVCRATLSLALGLALSQVMVMIVGSPLWLLQDVHHTVEGLS